MINTLVLATLLMAQTAPPGYIERKTCQDAIVVWRTSRDLERAKVRQLEAKNKWITEDSLKRRWVFALGGLVVGAGASLALHKALLRRSK